MSSKPFFFLFLCLFCFSCTQVPKSYVRTGNRLCLTENLYFHRLKRASGKSHADALRDHQYITSVDFTTSDGVTLRGFKFSSWQESREEPLGYVLYAQSGIMLAEQVTPRLKMLSDEGYDCYIFDYRGFGLSEGRSLLGEMFIDYREVAQHLNLLYERGFLYGSGLGGAILMNADDGSLHYTGFIIDATPSYIPLNLCAKGFHPIENLPRRLDRTLIISGFRDKEVSPDSMQALIDYSKGAEVEQHPLLGHPFLDGDPTYTIRLPRVRKHILKYSPRRPQTYLIQPDKDPNIPWGRE